MAEGQQEVKVGIEKELTCSICTDIIFQPLTLLDCYHTFCGSCLKEWFAFQASAAQSIHPYTCPSCRASVRGTKANLHFVVSLLDEFHHANPTRRKSEQEQEEEKKKYKPGDNVLPKLRRRRSAPDDEQDRELLDEVRQASLAEVGVSSRRRHGSRDPSRHRRSREARSTEPTGGRRHRRAASTDLRPGSQGRTSPGSQRPAARNPPGRQASLEHQASLRSLLSVSDLRPQDLEEEILRQIMEEGLLDGIDLNNIDGTQEEALSETIAQAYRRRQEQRRRERRARDRSGHASGHSGQRQDVGPLIPSESSRHHTRQDSGHANGTAASQAVVTPESPPVPIDHGGATSHPSQSPRNLGTTTVSGATPIASSNGPARTSDNNAERNLPSESEINAQRRQTQEHEGGEAAPIQSTVLQVPNQSVGDFGRDSVSPRTVPASAGPRRSRSPRVSPTAAQRSPNRDAPPPMSVSSTLDSRPGTHQSENLTTITRVAPPVASTAASPPRSLASRPAASRTIATEPSISCNRCGRTHIEYELHYNCHRCAQGKYNVCLPCYRLGRGCLHWYGVGLAAWERYQRQAPPEGYPHDHDRPHALTGRRYLRPSRGVNPDLPQEATTDDDPSKRLESGVFCDICSSFANACYWKCESCNDGAWGFCNRCVNQGRHCTHPLLPLTHKRSNPQSPTSEASQGLSPSAASPDQALEPASSPPLTPKSASILRGPGVITLANSVFRPLTFSTLCDFCTYPIPPSRTRYHCPKCNDGDYDICTSCYQSLVHRGGISADNGHQGWRRCIKGHRMVVVGFEDRDGGQRRVVVRDLVGGVTLREEEAFASTTAVGSPRHEPQQQQQLNWYWSADDGTVHRQQGGHSRQAFVASSPTQTAAKTHSFPPDGGVGLRGVAKWGYFPGDGVADELMFPRGAEIREAEDINHDWFWGVYCGAKGLFPGGYVQIIGRVGG